MEMRMIDGEEERRRRKGRRERWQLELAVLVEGTRKGGNNERRGRRGGPDDKTGKDDHWQGRDQAAGKERGEKQVQVYCEDNIQNC